MNIDDIDQGNVLDGSPLLIDPHYDATFITISDREENPLILALSTEDLKVFHDAYVDRIRIDAGDVLIEPHPEVEDDSDN
ncbi:hypothetical protein phi16_gp041 [Corynebacterium phage phi16]|uniref:hypothetical protein n=1 Tax=Corynebacterium glutamicum TaxID=1718 RepID=UPI0009455D0E|nr:hypothetical protein [Corynebacterium glutamicum]APQ42544.1 hypothetical protein phi16_gp041 [Corynebacterium phage phi16]OKX80550.1 hypothetical protein AUO95_10420 [Corynebacterium glutamicum]